MSTSSTLLTLHNLQTSAPQTIEVRDYVISVKEESDRQVAGAKLAALRGFVETLIAEDEPILNTMRFRRGVLVAADQRLPA